MSTKELIVPLLAVVLLAGGLFYMQTSPGSNLTSQDLKCQNRMAIMLRAQRWVDMKIGYNQQSTFQGWRTDAAGYVSMAWNLNFAKPGLTTSNMHIVSTKISKDQLQNGDAMNCDSRHIVIFGGWSDSTKSHYWSFQESNPSTGTIKSVVPYPFWNNDACFHPIKYNDVC